MGELVSHTINGISCDKRGCIEHIRGPEMRLLKGQDYYHALAYQQGWTCWANRGRRWYCPNHGPSNNHTMRELRPRGQR